MLSKISGILNKIIFKFKFGNSICFDGIPSFISHMQMYVRDGNIKIGKGFSIKQGVYIAAVDGGNINIGKGVSLNRNCILVSHKDISIGDNVAIGPNVVFYDHDHNFGENGIKAGYKTGCIVIGNNCWIGANVTILRGTHIGEGSIIGAGCIVQGNIPPRSLVKANRELVFSSLQKTLARMCDNE